MNAIKLLAAEISDRFNRPQAAGMVEDVIREGMPDVDALDTHTGVLLAALERIARDCTCPASQLAVDALAQHKAWLTTR